MTRKAYSPERVVRLPRGVDAALAAGKTVEEAWSELGVAASSYHRWRNQSGGVQTGEVRRLKENERLKRSWPT